MLSDADVLVGGAVGVVPESVDVGEVEVDVDVVVREMEVATWLPWGDSCRHTSATTTSSAAAPTATSHRAGPVLTSA